MHKHFLCVFHKGVFGNAVKPKPWSIKKWWVFDSLIASNFPSCSQECCAAVGSCEMHLGCVPYPPPCCSAQGALRSCPQPLPCANRVWVSTDSSRAAALCAWHVEGVGRGNGNNSPWEKAEEIISHILTQFRWLLLVMPVLQVITSLKADRAEQKHL